MLDNVPGEIANAVLRTLGVLELLASVILAFWIFNEFGSTRTDAVGITLGIGVLMHGVLIAALFFAIAAIGDNLIAVRLNTNPPQPEVRGIRTQGIAREHARTCGNCGHINDDTVSCCQRCGVIIRGGAPTPGTMSGTDLRRELTRRRVIQEAEAGTLDLGNADNWHFIMDHGLPEIAKYVLDQTQEPLRTAHFAHEREAATEKFRDYFLSQSPEVAKDHLYGCIHGDANMWQFAYAVIRDRGLFDSERIREVLGSENRIAKRRCVQLAAVDAGEYGVDDIPGLELLAHEIQHGFAKAEVYSKKATFGQKELWACECGNEVRAEEERCTACQRDPFGFGEGVLLPDQAATLLREKANALRSLFKVPFQQDDAADELLTS